MKRYLVLIATIAALAFGEGLQAAVRLPKLVSSGMVLQRDVPLNVWGWAEAHERVRLTLEGKTFTTTANDRGEWRLTLPAQRADGKPHSMTINEHTLNDVVFGDVWLCSGQSNMELPLQRVLDLYRAELEQTSNAMIREFHVPVRYNFLQVEEDFTGGAWRAAAGEALLDFSAVAYFFGKELYDTYKIPIGLINASLGGSPAEAWISEQNLRQFPGHVKTLRLFQSQAYCDSLSRTDRQREKVWYATLHKNDEGVARWMQDKLDLSTWGTTTIPGYWFNRGLGNLNGSVWFRKEFEVLPSMAGKAAELRLGCIVDGDSTFVNGVFVGTVSYQYPPRIYSIPAGVLREGKNSITVRVISNIGHGGFVPDKAYRVATATDTVDLRGEWHFKVGAIMPPLQPSAFIQWKPVGLYNGMIAPMLRYAVKGVVWYQGESNTGNPTEYATLFPALIKEWREKFGGPNMPFLYVQLANFMQAYGVPTESGWAALREAQRKTLSLPNTGMVVATDIGEWNDIHPLNKKEVGLRLARWAKRLAYGDRRVVASGPLYKSMQVQENKAILSFTEQGGGLAPVQELRGFAVAGEDGKFVWARARIEKNGSVEVWSEEVSRPMRVRYAWADNPEGANLRNKEGLPASPFEAMVE